MNGSLSTHSVLCGTQRDYIARMIEQVRAEGLTVPREVLRINLREEEQDANVIEAAMRAAYARGPRDRHTALDELGFQLSEALAEVTRKPAPGGRTRTTNQEG